MEALNRYILFSGDIAFSKASVHKTTLKRTGGIPAGSSVKRSSQNEYSGTCSIHYTFPDGHERSSGFSFLNQLTCFVAFLFENRFSTFSYGPLATCIFHQCKSNVNALRKRLI